MSDILDSTQSPPVLAPFPFSEPPSLSEGPLTVVNPEKRGLESREADGRSSERRARPGPSSSPVAPGAKPGSGVDFELGSRLFPNEYPAVSEIVSSSQLAGVRLEHFELQERIGIGGMGAVFRAVDLRLQRVVALKVLSPSQSRDASAIQRFQNEAQAGARLDHENIARVFHVGQDRGIHFIAFEYVEGVNLRELIRSKGKLDPAEAVNYTLQIASAVRHTNAAGVVHRDIKPSNIIISDAGRAKLVDLGLARTQSVEGVADLTIAGTTLGTFDYISPEQARDPRNVDVRSDIYSLGCTLYHMLTGEPPYPEGTVLQKLLDHQGGDSPDPASKNSRVPAALSVVVRRMMASDPRRRYATPEEVIRDLLAIAGHLGLRIMGTEGLVWSGGRSRLSPFWEKNLPWMLTASVLLLVVIVLDRYPSLGQRIVATPEGSAAAAGQGDLVADSEPSRARPGGTNRRTDSSRSITGSSRHPGVDSADPHNANQHNADQHNLLRQDGSQKSGMKVGPIPEFTSNESPGPEIAANANSNPRTEEGTGKGRPAPNPPREGSTGSRPSETAGASGTTRPGNEGETKTGDGSAGRDTVVAIGSAGTKPTPVRNGSSSTGDSTGSTGPANNPPAGTSDQTKSNDPGRTTDPRVEPKPAPAIALLPLNGGEPKPYPTLEAACAQADDGQIIELRYNGARPEPEKPLRISNRKITIRGAKGFRPIVDFVVKDAAAPGQSPRMMTVAGGAVEFNHVELRMTVGDSFALKDGDWAALLSLGGAEQVRFQGVVVTVVNPSNRPAAIVEIAPPPGQAMSKMKMMAGAMGGERPRFDVRFLESFLRGNTEVAVVRHTNAGQIDLDQSAVSVDGALLAVLGGGEPASQETALRLHLEHVTAAVGNGLIRVDSGDGPRDLLPISVHARNNLIASRTPVPLVSMMGTTNAEDFRRLLRWHGEKNFYDRIDLFWTIVTPQGIADFDTLDFDAWKRIWSDVPETSEVGATRGKLAWKERWWERPAREIIPSDLELTRDGSSPALNGATDGSDAGAALSKLPALAAPAP